MPDLVPRGPGLFGGVLLPSVRSGSPRDLPSEEHQEDISPSHKSEQRAC